ncbi:MAG: hypothetical protein JSR61_00725 [Proteobacteria bacterium]|nr:hypothetical protein [Pseudomonadota bacterium]
MSRPGAKKAPPEHKSDIQADTVSGRSDLHPSPASLAPSDIYSPQCLEIARAARSHGATDAELCAALGISVETLVVWQTHYKEFAKACEDNEAAQTRCLKARLYELAKGYTRTEQKITIENGVRKVVITKVEVPPDLQAIKYVMTNQQPSETDLAAMLRQMAAMRTHRVRPVPLRPGEEKTLEDWPGSK